MHLDDFVYMVLDDIIIMILFIKCFEIANHAGCGFFFLKVITDFLRTSNWVLIER